MKVDVYNHKNEKVESLEMPEKVFNARWNPDLVKQAVTVQLANRREVLAHAKGRGEVRGGGKKPWAQKGTGRSRQGSTRSPLWVHGGVAHGPKKDRNFTKGINKKMIRRALASVLSKKLQDKEIKVVDTLHQKENAKTRMVVQIVRALQGESKGRVLLIADSANRGLHAAASNIARVDTISAKSLNVYDILKNKNLIIEKAAIKEIETHYKI